MVSLTIDGKKVEVPEGTKILDAALQYGIEIPHLCHHPELAPFGGCRLCLVEAAGQTDLLSSCVEPVREGMEVLTDTPRILRARRSVVQLLLLNHPLDCFICERGGNCMLQKLAFDCQVVPDKYKMKKRVMKGLQRRTILEIDPKKCVHCGLCVRTCKEMRHQGAINFYNRGFKTEIGIPYGDEANCEFCGQCVEVCPVAGVIGLDTKYLARPWEVTQHHTVCPYCGTGCLLTLHTKSDKIAKVGSEDKSGVNEGKICVKGRFGCGFVMSEERLKTPMIKKNGQLQPVTWREALEYTARRLKELVDKYGGDMVGGLGSVKSANEDNYLFQKFMRAVIGSNNIDNPSRLEHSSTVKALGSTLGIPCANNSLDKLSAAEVILVIGSNPSDTHPIVSLKIRNAVLSGKSKLIVVDPRKVKLSFYAHKWLNLKPGTDAAFLGALMYIIASESLGDSGFISSRTRGYEEFCNSLKEYAPARVAQLCGVDKDRLTETARLIAGAGSLSIVYSAGITQHIQGTQNVAALADLFLLTGQAANEDSGIYPLLSGSNSQGACDMGVLPDYLPGYQELDDKEAMEKFASLWQREVPVSPGMSATQMFKAMEEGRLKALYVMGYNPIRHYPNSRRVAKALGEVEFLVVHDLFMSETARLAEVVFPAASFAERNGTVTNMERRVQPLVQAIDPPGEALPDWEIVARLSRQMGYPMEYENISQVLGEINGVTPLYGGIDYLRLQQEGGLFWPCPDSSHPGTRFIPPCPSGDKCRFAPLPAISEQIKTSDDYPFKLIIGKTLFHSPSGTLSMRSKALKEIAPDGFVDINPQDAARMGIEDNDMVRITSSVGNMEAKARLIALTPEGVVFMSSQFASLPVQELIPDNYDPVSHVPALKECVVNISKVVSTTA